MLPLYPVIAIDGPAASGKSTVARALAAHFSIPYVNTGTMYRAIAWLALEKGIDPADQAAVENLLDETDLTCSIENGMGLLRLNGEDPEEHLRTEKVNKSVSLVAAIPAVRKALVELQQGLGFMSPLVMEGRDIGSVVFPDSPFKLYIDASPEVRAQRRQAEGQTDPITQRDQMDSSRKDSPLTIAPDAHIIDSSHLSAEEVMQQAMEHLQSLQFAQTLKDSNC